MANGTLSAERVPGALTARDRAQTGLTAQPTLGTATHGTHGMVVGDGMAVGDGTAAGDGRLGAGDGAAVDGVGVLDSVGAGAGDGGVPVGPPGVRSGHGRPTTTTHGSMTPGSLPLILHHRTC
jgi:hypothetical protein